MRVNMTQRAAIAFEKADSVLKRRLESVFRTLESGGDLSHEEILVSKSRPGVFIVDIDGYRLVFQPGKDVIEVLDIVSRSVAYQ